MEGVLVNRRAKVIIAVALCIIPIAAVFFVWSQPRIIRHEEFDAFSGRFVTVEINVSIGWPHGEFQVVINVTDRSHHLLAGGATIYDSALNIIDSIVISDVGNYSTSWLPAIGDISIVIFNHGLLGAFIEGEISVWGRHPILRIWYGD